MDTHRLRSFLHVAELGSLSKAAQRLHVSQPALSRQIQLLEDEIGAQLFHRTGRGMTLTAAGRTLSTQGRDLLSQMDQLRRALADEAKQISGRVRIAIPPSLGVLLPAEVLKTLQDEHPQIEVQVIIALSGAVADALSRGQLDLGIVYASVSGAQLRTEVLYREVLWLVGPPQSKLRTNAPLTLRQALLHPMVLPTRRHGLRITAEEQASQRGLQLQVRSEIDGLRLLVELVNRGAGYSLLPKRAIEAELAEGRVTAAPIRSPQLKRTALLAIPSESAPNAAVQALAGVLRRKLKRSS